MSQGFCTSYPDGLELEKLSELRAKTERQVLSIIHSKLDLGLNFVALAEETDSGGNPDHAGQLLWRAEQTVIEVKQLLPVLTDDQYRSVGPQLNKLRGSSRSPGCAARSEELVAVVADDANRAIKLIKPIGRNRY